MFIPGQQFESAADQRPDPDMPASGFFVGKQVIVGNPDNFVPL